MKKENGMTLITTVVLVVVITALVFAVVYYARIAIAKEELENLKTDLLLVQAQVKKIGSQYTLSQKEEELKGTKIAEMLEDEEIKKIIEKEEINIEEKDKKYYVLTKQDLEDLELSKIKLEQNSYYIVEYTSNEIYYTKGVQYADGNTYYKITDIANLEASEVE